MKISVALAAYDGGKYISEQILSILPQLSADDEIIISDDYPAGSTKAAVESIMAADSRIKYVEGPGKGVCKNFENAMRNCSGDIIFLCDQDDVWVKNKVERVLAEFDKGAALVLHDASVTDESLQITEKSYFAVHGVETGLCKTLARNTFVGCCMAFRREVLGFSLPLPGQVPMHDWWIALAVIKRGLPVHIVNEPLILWRRHGKNVTGGKTSFANKLRWRAVLAREISKI